MERRDLLATFMVTNNGDVGDGTLRDAIDDANASTGSDLIRFDLAPGADDPAPHGAAALSDPGTVIDATTQTGYAGAPLVVLDGSQVPAGSSGLTLTGGNGGVRGLVINGFGGAGGSAITISGGGRNVIQNNYLGTNAAGPRPSRTGPGSRSARPTTRSAGRPRTSGT
jgi:hypothetical protein